MIGEWVEGDALVCDERGDPIPVSLPQVKGDGFTGGHASVDVQVYQVPVILVNEESAVGGGEETIKPG